MAKKMSKMEPKVPMTLEMPIPAEMMPYEGRVREDILQAATQSDSFLNMQTHYGSSMDAEMREMMKDHLKADLIATGHFAIQNTIGGRAIAARIRDEASRIWDERDVETWF